MNNPVRPQRDTFRLEITAHGYLQLSRQDAADFFPEDVLVVVWKEDSLVLLPTRGAAAGGLMLKQRNVDGDRSLLVSEVFDFDIPTGHYVAKWDQSIGGVRVAMKRSQPESA